MKDKSRIFINSAIVFTTTISENIIFFIVNIIIARYLNINQFGEYTTALGYATFFSTLTNIGINQALIRANNINPDQENANFSAAVFIKVVLAFLIYAVMSATLYFTNYSSELVILALVMGVFRMGSEILSAFYALYDSKENFIRSSIYKIAFSVLFLTLTFGVIYFEGGIFDFAYIRVWLVLFFLALLIISSINKVTVGINKAVVLIFIKQSVPFGISTIIENIYQRTNIIILSIIHASVYAGIFSNGFIFFTTLFLIPNNISKVIMPYLYKASLKDEPDKFNFAYEIYTKYMTMISFYFFLGAVLYAENIIMLIFGLKYFDSIIILKIIAAGIPFIFTIAPTIITSLDRQRDLAKIYIVGFVISIISNFVLIYYYKAKGAALAAVISYGFIFIACNYYLILNRIVSISSILKPIFSQSVICIICLIGNVILPEGISPILSLTSLSLTFFLLNIIFVVNKNDARIVMEILNIKNFPVRIYK